MQASTVATPTVEAFWHDFRCDRTEPAELAGDAAQPGQRSDSRHRVEGGDHAELLALIGREANGRRSLGAVPAVVSCYEAGYDGFWLHRLLLAAGITNFVFDPASIAVDSGRGG